MKTRKTMLERLTAYHKKHGGFVTVIKLSEMVWKYMTVLDNSVGTFYGVPKRVRVPRTMHTYRLKSARGRYNIHHLAENGAWIVRPCVIYRIRYLADDGVWRIRYCDTYQIPHVTYNPLQVFADLHKKDREVSSK